MEWIAPVAALLLLAIGAVLRYRGHRMDRSTFAPGDPRSLPAPTPALRAGDAGRCARCGAPLDESGAPVCDQCWGWSER